MRTGLALSWMQLLYVIRFRVADVVGWIDGTFMNNYSIRLTSFTLNNELLHGGSGGIKSRPRAMTAKAFRGFSRPHNPRDLFTGVYIFDVIWMRGNNFSNRK
jgi:hypothetical protein